MKTQMKYLHDDDSDMCCAVHDVKLLPNGIVKNYNMIPTATVVVLNSDYVGYT